MKNFYVIQRLWTDSRENQSPQRFCRYAVMLLMLLTLGVGQMWADPYNFNWYGNVFFRAPDNWNLSTNSTVQVGLARTTSTSTSTYCFYFGTMTRVGSTRLYYCWISADHSSWGQNEYIFFTANPSAKSAGDRKVNSHACYTAPYNYGVANNNCPYLFNPTSESNGASVSGTCYTSGSEYKDRWYPLLDKAQTVNLYTNGSSSNTGGSVTIAGTYMSAANTTTTTGSATSSTTSVNYTTLIGSSVSLTATPATGYQFDGWYTAGTGGDLVSSSNPYSYTCTGTKTVYARFKSETYNGTIDKNGGAADKTYTATYMSTALTIAAAPTKTGYNVSGYYTSASCTTMVANASKNLQASTSYTNSSSQWTYTSSAPKLYAGWTAKTYSITLHDNVSGSNNGSATATYDGGLSSLSAPTKSGYHVDGYYKEAELTNKIANADGSLVASTSYTDASSHWTNDGAVTLYAKWEEDAANYTLTYGVHASGHGTLAATNTSTSAAISSGASVAASTGVTMTASPSSYYELEGWYNSSGCSSTIAGWGTTNPKSFTLDNNYTIYAKFQPITYTITYNLNSGSNPGDEPTSYTVESEDVTLPTPTRSGYIFAGWYANADLTTGGVHTKITSGSNGDKTYWAKWTENMTTVTVNVSPASSGTLTVNSSAFTPGNTTTAGVATSRTVVATAQPGYKFSSWGTAGNATGTSSTNTYTLKGNGSGSTGTLTANFNRLYAYVQGRFQVKDTARSTTTTTYASGGQWEDSGTKIQMDYDNTNHRFVLHTHMTPSELTANHGTGCDDCKPYFFIKTSTSNSSLAGVTTYMCTSAQTLATAGSANGKTVSSSSGLNTNLRFNSSTTSGYAVVYFDQSKIWYELEYRLQYNANGGSGTAPTGTNGHNSYHATSTTAASNTFTARAYYTFGGWNTAQYITGTNYDAGASVPMTANTTLYAKWTRNVTLNQENATTTGSTSVTGTYNCATLPAITNPEKTGYDFGGWYTETAGEGNLVINTSGQLQASKYHWTDANGRFDRTTEKSAADLYAKWTQTITLNANIANHGSGDNTTATIVYKATAKTSITHCTPATGYHLVGYYSAATGGTMILDENGDFADDDITVSEDDYIVDGAWVHAGSTTLYAHYEPNTYDVILDVNGATSGSNQTVVATFDDDMPTTQKTSGAAITAPSKTGYTFGGYWTNNTGTGTQYYTDALASKHVWDVATNNTHIYAKWTANGYTVTLDIDEDNHGTIDGKDTEASVTFDAAPTSIASGKLPTAANGYALDGYYTDHDGEGTKLINGDGTWIASVAGYTDGSGNWIHDGDETLYAYYKKAEITALVASPGIIAPSGTVTITPTISPTPTGTTKVCYELQYSNGTPLPSQPGMEYDGTSVSFAVPTASATYIIQATLAKGSDCPADPDDVLSTRTTTFQVAGEHTVTIRYQDSDGRTLQASASIEARPLDWTTDGDITPPTITGYKFDHWDAGDGVTIKNGESDPVTTTTTSSIQIKATYDGTLTAVYAKKKLIFFNNTLGWSNVYVYFYNTNKYWSGDYGSGAKKDQGFGDGESEHPYWEQEHGHMTNIEGTNIWYFDYEAAGYSTRENVVFTEANQHDDRWFWRTKAVRRGDHISDLQLFVPLTTKSETKNETDYYNSGYWMNYPENTGYSLLIYNQKAKDGATKLYEFPFEFTEDFTMPMELVVDLEAGQTYGFEIKRADGTYYSNTGTMTANTTNWSMSKDQSSYCGLQTTAAGNYTFRLYYSSSSYRMDVTYPVAVNDYRIVYTDLATWSKDAHTASWSHPSRVITKNSSATKTKKDTVSFFWTYGSSPAIAYQTCSAVAAGSASWSARTSISVSSYSSVLTEKGIYNFIFEQPAGGASISLIGVEPYTGKYYIRTDCAGSTKWSNFQSTDHEMTYSDYTKENHGYSHYYPHWVTTGQNVKFCIANDYSQCITDTLVEDKGTVVADITTEGNANAGRLNSGNASIRFMWNQATNKISRAYISGSTNISDRFLVLEGDAKMFDAEGNALSISGLNANEINLVDDQNFVYEREIKVRTGARAKLTAKYNNNVQYFRGSEGAFAEGTTVELLGGSESATKHTMRIVYDFKTNRLMTAYVPSGTIEDDIAINADLMIVREHQEAGQQLIFNGGSLSKVHTVYGVMRFNRWTLNNKETTGEHSPVGDPKSAYERGLYWISFPFDVNLSDVFGFGTYGTHWIIMEYDGAERAQKGYWRDSEGFWKYVTNRTNKVLEAGKGYVLALDLDLMRYDDDSFWSNNIEQVELFFPSTENVGAIEATNVTTSVESHACTIDRTGNNGSDINKNRTRADSHWNIIGTPSYANYGTTLTSDGSTVVTWNSSPYTNDLPFLYEWSTVDNTYSVQSGTTYPFKAMHAYMVQYNGDLYWSLASATPASIVARRTYAEKPQNVEMRLELSQNEKKIDQTFVKLSNDENASANFVFDEDLCKEYNANKANIYTFIEGYIPAAGNTLPMSDQTTVVPVGVKIAANGDYTFSMPDGTEGIGVTLIDNETGIRTSLSALDYTINLSAGTYENRFVLEISPIKQTPTGVELINGENGENGVNGVRKVMIDGILYIVKDGKMFDARGTMVK